MTLLIVSFIAGVLTVLAPCVLPLLPVILGGTVAGAGDRRRPFIIIAALAVSVLVFTLLLKGGTALISVPPSVWAYISGGILVIFGLSLVFPDAWARLVLKIPGHTKPDMWMSSGASGKSGLVSDIVVGAALGPVFTTCSPTFFVILATVLPQNLAAGIVDLLAYVIGLSISLLAISLAGERLVRKLGWAADPYGWFRRSLGVLFVILGVFIATGVEKKIETAILDAGYFDVTRIEQSVQRALEHPFGSEVVGTIPAAGGIGSEGDVRETKTTSPAPLAKRTLSPGTPSRYVEIRQPAGFVNAEPFALADLVGKKVILLDFMTYSCINCQRTFPYLNEWYRMYKDRGLEIVAIHTPEFSFEKNIDNVRDAAARFGLEFPLVLDNDYATWSAYGNRYWPHKYLIDLEGNIVYDHIGEGGYDDTKAEIEHLLPAPTAKNDAAASADLSSSKSAASVGQARSPETYFGALRNELFGNGRPFVTGTAEFVMPLDLSPNHFYLGGSWSIEREYAESSAKNARLSYVFDASNVYIVAESATGRPISVGVMVDGQPLSAAMAGEDVSNSMLEVGASRLYHLYSAQTAGPHRIDIIFSEPGVRAYTFTFG